MHRFRDRVGEHGHRPVQALDPLEVQLPVERREQGVGRRRLDRRVGRRCTPLDHRHVLDAPSGEQSADAAGRARQQGADGVVYPAESLTVDEPERHLVEQVCGSVRHGERQAVSEVDARRRQDGGLAQPEHTRGLTAPLDVVFVALHLEDRDRCVEAAFGKAPPAVQRGRHHRCHRQQQRQRCQRRKGMAPSERPVEDADADGGSAHGCRPGQSQGRGDQHQFGRRHRPRPPALVEHPRQTEAAGGDHPGPDDEGEAPPVGGEEGDGGDDQERPSQPAGDERSGVEPQDGRRAEVAGRPVAGIDEGRGEVAVRKAVEARQVQEGRHHAGSEGHQE